MGQSERIEQRLAAMDIEQAAQAGGIGRRVMAMQRRQRVRRVCEARLLGVRQSQTLAQAPGILARLHGQCGQIQNGIEREIIFRLNTFQPREPIRVWRAAEHGA